MKASLAIQVEDPATGWSWRNDSKRVKRDLGFRSRASEVTTEA